MSASCNRHRFVVLTPLILLCVGHGVRAQSQQGLHLERVPGEETGSAVLDLGAHGAFDDEWVGCPTVLRVADKYLMWYSSYFDSRSPSGGIGLAVSSDGVHWERAAMSRHVLRVGDAGMLDAGQIMGPCVLRHRDGFRMWYTGMDDVPDGDRIRRYRVFLAESEDGVAWRRANGGQPVIDLGPIGSVDSVQVATPSVLRDGDSYRMWYAAWSKAHGHTICAAHSADGVSWIRDRNGRPVIGLPSDSYGPEVCRMGNQYLMLFMTLKSSAQLYGAVSDDGCEWTMVNDSEPILPAGEAHEFDAAIQGHAAMMIENGILRVWYTGYRRNPDSERGLELRIGLAQGAWRADGSSPDHSD